MPPEGVSAQTVFHVARSRHRLRTRCGRQAKDVPTIDPDVARDPVFWEPHSTLRIITASRTNPAICVACAALPSGIADAE